MDDQHHFATLVPSVIFVLIIVKDNPHAMKIKSVALFFFLTLMATGCLPAVSTTFESARMLAPKAVKRRGMDPCTLDHGTAVRPTNGDSEHLISGLLRLTGFPPNSVFGRDLSRPF